MRQINDKYVIGEAFFDDGPTYRAICNLNSRWNGWYMPFISEKDIEQFIKDTGWDDMKLSMDGRVVVCEHDGEVSRIKPTGILGEEWYYFGDYGWCFNFKTEK